MFSSALSCLERNVLQQKTYLKKKKKYIKHVTTKIENINLKKNETKKQLDIKDYNII